MPNITEDRAIDEVTSYLRKQGYCVQNVSRGKRHNPEHRGYDLIASNPAGENLKIEVKGCNRLWQIPDPYETEFDQERRLIADFLYVVYPLDSGTKLCIIPRDAIKPEDIVPKKAYRFRSHFKNEKSLSPYLREL